MNELVPFEEFLRRTAAAKHEGVRSHPATLVSGPDQFQEMRDYILSLYRGIEVVHSFLGPDGHPVDCVPIDQQPSLRQPSGSVAKVATPPPAIAPPAATDVVGEKRSGQAVEPHLCEGGRDVLGNEQCCPPGTIPMRRITLEQLTRFENLQRFFRKGGGLKGHPRLTAHLRADTAIHRYAHAYQIVQNNGGSSQLNLWNPTVPPHDFSLSQHWYAGGSGTTLQTVEAGWQVYPNKYGTTNAVLFIYWTADGYNQTGNYNLDRPAFVQTDHTWVLGAGFSKYSTAGGEQMEFRVHWQRDTANGNWWLFLQGGGNLTPIGYYPRALFGNGQLASCATDIDYGGEVTGNVSGQMGSGAFANTGWQQAAYQRDIFYFSTAGSSSWATLSGSDTPTCYTIDVHNNAGGGWGSYFFFGGPRCG